MIRNLRSVNNQAANAMTARIKACKTPAELAARIARIAELIAAHEGVQQATGFALRAQGLLEDA